MRRAAQRGFTLVELMIVVAIVGIIASAALPNLRVATLRARKAEREVVLDAVRRGCQAIIVHQGKFPADSFVGNWNPGAGTADPKPFKKTFDTAAENWSLLDLQIEGKTYHSYKFVGTQGADEPMTLSVFSLGDLDGDAVLASKTVAFEMRDGGLFPVAADPDELAADEVRF